MKPPGTNAGSGSIYRLGPQLAGRPSIITRPNLSGTANAQNSNRECIRLETAVTQTRQRVRISSNREKEAWFFGPSRGGSFLSDPPAFRPRLCRREPMAKTHIHPAATDRNSNREGFRLETTATQTKQRIPISSNREKEAWHSPSKFYRAPGPRNVGGRVHHAPVGFGCSSGFGWIACGQRQHPRPRREGGEPPPLRTASSTAGKNRNRLPPKVLRLKRRPAICFL
jgi:hypothetical protein